MEERGEKREKGRTAREREYGNLASSANGTKGFFPLFRAGAVQSPNLELSHSPLLHHSPSPSPFSSSPSPPCPPSPCPPTPTRRDKEQDQSLPGHVPAGWPFLPHLTDPCNACPWAKSLKVEGRTSALSLRQACPAHDGSMSVV